ncbi:MAG: pilus assembly protein [Chloroflexota bacterium]|nr:pilus assembly protein [Chloroflexota bacterium]
MFLKGKSKPSPVAGDGTIEPLAHGARGKSPGQAFVEFALGLPLMLLIMLGTLDIGQVFIDYVQLRNACREAASYGARNPTKTPQIINRVYDHSPMMSDGGTTVSVRLVGNLDPTDTSSTKIVIDGTRTFEPIMTGFLSTWFGIGTLTLEAQATAEVFK